MNNCMSYLVLVATITMLVRSVASEEMQAGMAVVDITPPVPYRMSGYFSERLSTGIKDPPLAKSALLY